MPLDVRLPQHSQTQDPRLELTGRSTTSRTIRARDIQSAFAISQQAMAQFDADGRLMRTNRQFDEILALDEHPEFRTLDLRERARLLNPRDRRGRRVPLTRLPVARALRGDALVGVVGVDLRVRALDGRELELHVAAMPLSVRSGRITGCIVVVHDLSRTQRVSAQLQEFTVRLADLSRVALARAQERDSILEAIADGVLIFDAGERLLRLNAAALTLLGIAPDTPPAAVLAQAAARLADMPHTDHEGRPLPREAWPLEQALRGEQAARSGREAADAIRRLLDGRDQVLSVSAAPIYQGERLTGAVLLLRDETVERRREREAAEHVSQIEGIFEAMTDGLALYDAAGRVVRMNAAAGLLLGYDATEEWARRPLPLWSEHPALQDQSGRLLTTGTWPLARILQGETLNAGQAADVHIRRPDGAEGVLAVSGAPVYDNRGHIIGAVLSMRDVTEARRLDTERAQMMSTVSHELRTPLSVIGMAAGLIEKQAALSQPPSGDAIDFLTDGVALMTRLVNDLIDVVRMEVGRLALTLAPTDLRTLCQSVAGELMRTMQRVITLRLPAHPVEVNIDPIRISQVLSNLLSNALKYSQPESPVVLRLFRRRGMARVEVYDEGPGIPPEAQPRVFERFFRVPGARALHGSGVGLGLGLFIARTLIELHGGSIGVESIAGHGSTFWFTLPPAASASG